MSAHRYHPYYCEENVWWLCQHPSLADKERWAVFISNHARQCVFLNQRAANDELIVWDYHVIAIARDAGADVWDLDTRLGMPIALHVYLERTFPAVEAAFAPRFRVVEAAELVALLHSDRSHMRAADGSWLQPPPPWPPPHAGASPNLMRFIDMDSDIAGEVTDLDGLRRRFHAI